MKFTFRKKFKGKILRSEYQLQSLEISSLRENVESTRRAKKCEKISASPAVLFGAIRSKKLGVKKLDGKIHREHRDSLTRRASRAWRHALELLLHPS